MRYCVLHMSACAKVVSADGKNTHILILADVISFYSAFQRDCFFCGDYTLFSRVLRNICDLGISLPLKYSAIASSPINYVTMKHF